MLTSQETMKELRIARNTLDRMLKRGEFPRAYKIGVGRTSHWRIPEDDVRAYKERHSINSDYYK